MPRFIITCYYCPFRLTDTIMTYKVSCKTPHIQYTVCKKCYKKSLGEPTLRTEDDGKMFEMAICMALDIPYDGAYKYCMDTPLALKPRLDSLKYRFPNYAHSAKSGARYDYTSIGEPYKHISAKTTKKGNGKIAPQVIGQAQPNKFCDIIGIPYTTISELKKYIQENIATILPIMFSYTFDCPMLYYNVEKNSIRLLQIADNSSPIDWNSFSYTWTCDWTTWNNSSCVKIVKKLNNSLQNGISIPNIKNDIDMTEEPDKAEEKMVSLMEFQFHTKNRTNMAVRWCFEELLSVFGEHFNIENL